MECDLLFHWQLCLASCIIIFSLTAVDRPAWGLFSEESVSIIFFVPSLVIGIVGRLLSYLLLLLLFFIVMQEDPRNRVFWGAVRPLGAFTWARIVHAEIEQEKFWPSSVMAFECVINRNHNHNVIIVIIRNHSNDYNWLLVICHLHTPHTNCQLHADYFDPILNATDPHETSSQSQRHKKTSKHVRLLRRHRCSRRRKATSMLCHMLCQL